MNVEFATAGQGMPEEWILEIKKVWLSGAANTIELAKVVSAAKTKLHYGQWSQLWKSGQIPFSKSTADRLAVIGLRMGGLDSATSPNLPRGWNILYCLARLDRQRLERLIQQGTVHPQLTLRAAKELVAQFTAKRSPLRKANVRERLRRLAEFVDATLKDWTPEERERAEVEFNKLIEQIHAQRTVGSELASELSFLSKTHTRTSRNQFEAPIFPGTQTNRIDPLQDL